MSRPSANVTRSLYEAFSLISSSWPRDALRPGLSFGQTMLRAVEKALIDPVPTSEPPPQTASTQGVTTRINSRHLNFKHLSAEEKVKVEKSLRAIQSIREGRASKQVSWSKSWGDALISLHKNPVPELVLRPSTNASYYQTLHEILEKAAKGENVHLTLRQRLRLFFGKKAF